MTASDKAEINFWHKAIRIIHKGYGKPCKEFAFGCASCEANLAVAWIEKHIALIKWNPKGVRKT